MQFWFILFFSLFLGSSNLYANELSEAQLNFCTEKVDSGNYGSAGNQILCHKYFDLAPAYLVKCMRYEAEGFPSQMDQDACALYLEDLNDFGPWEDYEFPDELHAFLEKYRPILLASD